MLPARGCEIGRGRALQSHLPIAESLPLEAQQRYFSYRAILAAIVSQNSFAFVFIAAIVSQYRATKSQLA